MKSTKNLELVATKHSHIFRVKLNLEFQTRYIGTLDTSNGGKFITERKEKHLFRKTNSLGVNDELLNSPDVNFKYLIIDYEGKKLITTRLYFLTHSKAFTFKSFEKQYFLPVDLFGQSRAEDYEKSLGSQLGLFGEVA